MKKVVVLVVVSAFMLSAGTSVAATLNQKNTGCGLGSMIFADQNGLVSQTFAVTTNGTFGNGTFGITSGTSNCDRPATFASNQKLQEFVADNMDNLARDIARGSGEYLNTLAVLAGVPEGSRADFYGRLQANFSNIYTSDKVTHIDVIKNLEPFVTYL